MYDRSIVRPYTVLLLTCAVNCAAGTPTPRLCSVVQWSVHWAPSRTTRVLVLAGARRCALETCGKKKCELRFQAWLNLYISVLQALLSVTCFSEGLAELQHNRKKCTSSRTGLENVYSMLSQHVKIAVTLTLVWKT